MAVKPVAPPALDGKAFEAPLREEFPTAGGKPRGVYSGQLPRFLQWLRGEGEYDGKGLADAVKTNAVEQNQHIASDNARHGTITAELLDHDGRIAALEAAHCPFLSASG